MGFGANKMISDIDIYQNSLILTGKETPVRRSNHLHNSLLGNPTGLLNKQLMKSTLNEKKQQRLIYTPIKVSEKNDKET